MPTDLDKHAVTSIVKWELQEAPRGLFLAAHGKARMARDDALIALANRIAKRLEPYTITSHVRLDQSDMSRLATAPNKLT